MKYSARVTLAIVVAALMASPAFAAPTCPLHSVVSMANADARSGQTPLWRSADTGAAPIFFVVGFHTNTDGARRSYSVSDPWGEKDALNNLCNAMHGECHDLKTKADRLARMALVQSAAKAGWPIAQLAASRLSDKVIVMPGGHPCPLVDGQFLVSATALHRAAMKDQCDLKNYADSSIVPGIVIPGGTSELTKRGVRVGDLVAVLRPGEGQPVFGVVSDTGDAGKLGEAGMAMNQALLHLAPAANYVAIKHGWDVPAAFVMIFPGSRDLRDPYIEPERIMSEGQKRLGVLQPALAACGAAYGPAPQR